MRTPGDPLYTHSAGTRVKTQGAVTAVDGNKRGDLELVNYIGDGAQDLVLDFSMRHSRGGAAPRNWHRNEALRCVGSACLYCSVLAVVYCAARLQSVIDGPPPRRTVAIPFSSPAKVLVWPELDG